MAKKTAIDKIFDKEGILTPEELKVLYDKTNPGETVSVYEADSNTGKVIKQGTNPLAVELDPQVTTNNDTEILFKRGQTISIGSGFTDIEIQKLRKLLKEVAFDKDGRLYFRHMPCSISKDVFDRIFKVDCE